MTLTRRRTVAFSGGECCHLDKHLTSANIPMVPRMIVNQIWVNPKSFKMSTP